MPTTVPAAKPSLPVRTVDEIRPTPAKATLRSDAVGPASDLIGPVFAEAMKDAIVGHYGSVKATAYALGEGARPPRTKLDPSLMMREFKEGKFARLEAAQPSDIAGISKRMGEAFGDLTTPAARFHQLLRAVRDMLNEIEQYAEHIA